MVRVGSWPIADSALHLRPGTIRAEHMLRVPKARKDRGDMRKRHARRPLIGAPPRPRVMRKRLPELGGANRVDHALRERLPGLVQRNRFRPGTRFPRKF